MSITFRGRTVSQGIAMAELQRIDKRKLEVPAGPAEDTDRELKNLDHIISQARTELKTLYSRALEKLGPKEAEIFDAHLTLLEDDFSVGEPARELIRNENCTAAAALARQLDSIADMFRSLGDELMAARADDTADLKDLVVHVALGVPRQSFSSLDHDVIILADELVPSDTVRMDTSHVAGLATRLGGGTSHTAIIARTLGIPAVVGLTGWEDVPLRGTAAILDGGSGTLTVDPTPEEVEAFRRSKLQAEDRERELEEYRHKPSLLKDGTAVELCANIGTPGEAENAMRFGAEGVGLFRSEFLFMNRGDLPSEEEQYTAYRQALEAMGGRPVIVRTLDVGGDKKLPALNLPQEDNPFLGYRAVRMTLDRPDVFRPQLRALLRASAHGDLRIMFPMISGLEELRAAKALLAEERGKLAAENVPMGEVKVGMMIEIPSAAIMADLFAAEVDFFSIGTNDLIQYTLAAERGNEKVAHLYTQYHPAVLRLIASAGKAAREHGIQCGMCGEVAGDEHLAAALVGMGVTELSMSPRQIPVIRRLLGQVTLEQCQAQAAALLSLRGEQEVQRHLGLHKDPPAVANCPMCGRGCPIDAVKCDRGRAVAAKVAAGEPVDVEALRAQFSREGHSHGGHGGGEHGHRHGKHKHEGERPHN